MPRRTKPLARGEGLKRTESPLRRVRIAPISAGRREVNAARAKAQAAAWGPQPWACHLRARVGELLDVEVRREPPGVGYSRGQVTVPPCRGKVHGHEVLSRARAGRTDANLVDVDGQLPLCDGHNGWLTTFAAVPGLSEHSWS